MHTEPGQRLIPRDSIRKGDTVQVSWVDNDARKSVTGTAERRDWDGDWVTAGNIWLTDGTKRVNELVLLLARPSLAEASEGE
jgi:hypothetical protein